MLLLADLADRNAVLHGRTLESLLDGLSEADLRRKPAPTLNSIAWVLWPMGRCEDIGVNLWVMEQPQVLDDGAWAARLKIPLRIQGTGMSDDEVDSFSDSIDVASLIAYYDAVGRRSAEAFKTLDPSCLSEVVPPERQREILFGQGVLGENAEGAIRGYAGHTKGWFLIHFALTHQHHHMGEAMALRGMLGQRQMGDGKKRAAPDWDLRKTK